MQVMELIKKIQDNGASRISGALSEVPWVARRRRNHTFRWVMWGTGIAVGVALVAVLVWVALGRYAGEEAEEEVGLS
jgi:hypothetical protein